MLRSALVLAIVLSSALGSGAARADAVEGPPDACPAGSTPGTAHSGPHCRAAATCATDAECTGGATCEDVSQCIEIRQCGGLAPPDAAPCTLSHVSGLCGDGAACTTGACEVRRVCVAPGIDTTPGGGGCSCRVGARPAPAGVLTLLVVVGLGGRRRRS
jgi:MYXO-CTERM domain-containing protein